MSPTERARLGITEVVGSSICVSIEDGNRLHDAILAGLGRGQAVELSFAGVSRLTTAFLNAAVGQLYNEFKEEEVRTLLLPPVQASPEQLSLLKRVVDNAKRFFADRDRINKIVGDVRGDA